MFAARLKEIREEKGVSQYALAKSSGLSKQAISQLELGLREPNWQTVQLLALALGVDCTAFKDTGLELPDVEPSAGPGRPRKTAADTPPAATSSPAKPRSQGKPGQEPAEGKKGTRRRKGK